MGYPGSKVHRVSRRKLGRGQYPLSAAVTATLANPSADVISITFSQPVVVTGTIPLTTSTGVLVSQSVSSSTVVLQTYNVSQAAATVTLPGNAANVSTYQGGRVVGTTTTF